MVAVIKAEPGSPNPSKANHQQGASNYDPSTIYLLELASMIAIKNKAIGEAVSKDVVEVLQDVVRSSNSLHPLIVSRAAFCLLHVLNANYVSLESIWCVKTLIGFRINRSCVHPSFSIPFRRSIAE